MFVKIFTNLKLEIILEVKLNNFNLRWEIVCHSFTKLLINAQDAVPSCVKEK